MTIQCQIKVSISVKAYPDGLVGNQTRVQCDRIGLLLVTQVLVNFLCHFKNFSLWVKSFFGSFWGNYCENEVTFNSSVWSQCPGCKIERSDESTGPWELVKPVSFSNCSPTAFKRAFSRFRGQCANHCTTNALYVSPTTFLFLFFAQIDLTNIVVGVASDLLRL